MFDAIVLSIMSEMAQSKHDMLLSLAYNRKQERANQFHVFRDARNFLMDDILAHIEIYRLLGLSNNQLEFETNAYAKPSALGCPKKYYNISHSENYATCANIR